jgi:hypothetical protein
VKCVPLPDAIADLNALDQLRPRPIRVLELTQRAQDTKTALGSDVLAVALEAYGALKLSGRSEGLDIVVRDLGNRFTRSPRQAETEPVQASSSTREGKSCSGPAFS